MKKKVLLLGTSHAADVSRCFQKYSDSYFVDFHFEAAFFGVNLWRLFLNKFILIPSTNGLVSTTNFDNYSLSDTHLSRLQNLLNLLSKLDEYDIIIFVILFFKGWNFVPNVFSHVDIHDSRYYLKSVSDQPILCSTQIISAIPQVAGSFYALNGLYSEYIDSGFFFFFLFYWFGC